MSATRLAAGSHVVAPAEDQTDAVPGRRSGVLAALSVAILVAALSFIPVLRTPTFYLWDDSAAVFIPTWRAAGQELLAGQWPVLRPDFWMGGNWAAEAQFGFWNPVNLLLMMGVALIPNLAVGAHLVKLAFQLLLALGAFTLAREYGAKPGLAAAVSIALPFAGFTLYYDAATWVAGLMAAAWTPWFWWAIRRFGRGAANPLVPFAFGYLLMTNGNPYGALSAVIVLACVAFEFLLAKDFRAVGGLVAVGALVGATALVAYLPLVLSSSVGWRNTFGLITNDGSLVPNLTQLAASSTPSYLPFIQLWAGPRATTPITYGAWFLLPLLPWLNWGALRSRARAWAAPLAFLGIYLMLAIGPSNLWLFRWPVRLLEYVWLAVFVLLAALLSQGLRTSRPGVRAAVSGGIVLVGAWLAVSAIAGVFVRHALSLLVHAALVAVLILVILRARRLLAGVLVAGTALVLALQLYWMPANRDVAQWQFPTTASGMQAYAEQYTGPILQVANTTLMKPDVAAPWQVFAFGSVPGASGIESTSSYTGLGFSKFSETLCMNHTGSVCKEALTTAFAPAGDGVTVPHLVDALKVNTVVVQNELVPDAATFTPPAGWTKVRSDALVTVFQRTTALPWPGSRLAAAGAGVTVASAASTDTTEHVQVSTGASGGSLLFARLAWPGYSVTVGGQPATVVTNKQGLLEVALPAGLSDAAVDVRFTVPGYSIGVPVLIGAVAAALAYGVLVEVRRRAALRPGAKPDPSL